MLKGVAQIFNPDMLLDMMKHFFAAFLTIVLLALSTNAQAETDGLAVLELFTSPFCSDTLLAHEVFKNVAHDNNQNVIALSCHITYFNIDDKIDPLSTELCDERYKDYFLALNLRGILVPQVIINGQFDTEGIVERTVRAGVRMVQSMKTVRPVPLKLSANVLEITLPEMELPQPVDVWIFGYDRSRNEKIPLAPDQDITFNYTNVTRHLEKIPDWYGQSINISYPLKDIPADGYAVIVQYADHTNIIAAGKAEYNYSMPK